MSVILKVLFSALVLVASAEVAKRSGILGRTHHRPAI